MADLPYVESEEYQQEIAEQYKKRIGKFDPTAVIESLAKLGFNNIQPQDLQTTTAGNMNATYLTPSLVVKINKRGDMNYYYANKVVSDRLSGKMPVVEVLAYDYFDKTGFEILVMKRAPGQSLLDTIFDLSQKDIIKIFGQVLDVVKELQNIKFDNFGWVGLSSENYPSYPDFLKSEFTHHANIIKQQKLVDIKDLQKIEDYFFQHLSIFKNEPAVFVHTDAHMGNFIHAGSKLTALIDFDLSLKAPKVRALCPLLGFIEYPQQYTEGSIYFPKYKDKNFMFLLPTLKEKLRELFEDKLLLRKLNLIGINDNIMWVSENWSQKWNEEMIASILKDEIPEGDLSNSFYGKILGGLV